MTVFGIVRDDLGEYLPETMKAIKEYMSGRDRKKGQTDALNDLQPLVEFLYAIHKKNKNS
jgi:hypothetical protein